MSATPTASAWDRVLAGATGPWDERVELLRRSEAELRDVLRLGLRRTQLEQELANWTQRRDEANRELGDLSRRRTAEVDAAVDKALGKSLLRRGKAETEARDRAELAFDEQHDGNRRVVRARMNAAQREIDSVQAQLGGLGLHPMHRNDSMLGWLGALHDTVTATLRRDVRARDMITRPLATQRDLETSFLRSLTSTKGIRVAEAATFAEGSIHVIGGDHLAVVEVRHGGESLRVARDADGQPTLVDVRPTGERPLGTRTGGLRGLTAAASRVADVVGQPVQVFVCVLGWDEDPAVVGDVIVCSRRSLAQLLDRLPVVDVDHDQLAVAAAALAAFTPAPLPTPTPRDLDEYRTIQPGEVPGELEAVRRLIETAHSHAMAPIG